MIGLRSLISNKAPPLAGRYMSIPMAGLGPVNVESQMRAYGTLGILFAMVSRLSETVAAAEWGLYPKTATANDSAILNHPAAQLWENPVPGIYSRYEFVETFQQHLDLAGEADWFVGYPEIAGARLNLPIELWPIRPDKIQPLPSNTGNFLDGWVYLAPTGDRIPWLPEEVIQIKRPNPLDPYRGLGPVASAMVDIYGERAAAEYNAIFFRNSAEPGGIIQFEERMPDDDYAEFVARWREQHQGIANAHRVAILEGGTWVERRYTMREMQFEALRKLNRDFVRQAYGYPKSMLGDTEDVNKAAAIAGEYVFKQWLVRPRLDRIKATLNTKFLPKFPNTKGLEFRYRTPVPEDEELELREEEADTLRVKILIETGFDPAEVLEFVGLPPLTYIGAPGGNAGSDSFPQPPPKIPTDPLNFAGPGRPRLLDDPTARGLWSEAQEMRQLHPGMSLLAISQRLAVSERTLRRYKAAFEAAEDDLEP